MFTFSGVVVDLPVDCILSILFPAETDVLVPVFSQSTDVVVVNFVVVLKFPITKRTGIVYNYARRIQHGSVGSKKEKKYITKHHEVKTKKKTRK